MEFDVFLSYSSKDKPAADAACHTLEAAGVRCWMAPRDILPGAEWGASIVKAIAGAKAMVLIFSGNANESRQVTREVERAVNKGIPVIPVRIQDIMPTDALEYFLSTPHWLDAFTPPVESHFQLLVHSVRVLIGMEPQQPVAPTPSAAPSMPIAAPTARPPADRVTSRTAAALRPPLVTGTDLPPLCKNDAVLAKLNEALQRTSYRSVTITANEYTFGHSAEGDYCSVYWVGPAYDLDISYEVRRDNDRLEVDILDCHRIE
jgi:hypothetical protein